MEQIPDTKEKVRLEFESMCVGCQYPEHVEAVQELLQMASPEDNLFLEAQPVEYKHQNVIQFEQGVAVCIPGELGANRVGWVPTADLDDAKEFLKMEHFVQVDSLKSSEDKITRFFGHTYDIKITWVKWLDEAAGILQSFGFVITVEGLLRKSRSL